MAVWRPLGLSLRISRSHSRLDIRVPRSASCIVVSCPDARRTSGQELVLWPILAGMLVIGQTSNALLLHRGQKGGTVSFPVEHHGEAMKARIVLELLLAGLVRHIRFQARNQIAFHDLQQSRVD